MDRDSLVLRFDPDSDGTGKLLADVRFRGFAGSGSAWFGISELKEFADAIMAFPIPDAVRPSIAGGFWSKEVRGHLEQEHLALTVYPIGRRGQLGVQVRLATELWEGDREESQSSVKVELLTSYQQLAEFAQQLLLLVRGQGREAILEPYVFT